MVITYFFWFDRLDYFFINKIGSAFSAYYFDFGNPDNAVLIYVFNGLLFVPAMMNFMKMMSSGKIKVNKFLLLFMWYLFFAVVSGLVFPVASYTHFTLTVIPLAVIFSNWFLSLKKAWIAESLFIILLGAFIYAEIMSRI